MSPVSFPRSLGPSSRSTSRGAPRLPAGLALVALCLFGMIALPHWSAEESRRLRNEIRETLTPLEIALERLHREVLGLANDFRGYLITGDDSFLNSVDVQRALIESDFDLVGRLAADAGAPLAPRVTLARSAYEDWLAHSRLAAAIGPDTPSRSPLELAGPNAMRLEAFSREMAGLTRLMREREAGLRDRLVEFQRVEQLLVMILGLLAAVVVAYLGWLVTALVRAQTAALDERDQLEAVLASVDSGIVLLDRQLRVLAANERAGELLGLPLRELVGADQRRVARERLKPRTTDPDAFEKRLAHLYDNPEAVAEDLVEVALPEGRTLSRYSAPVRDDEGHVFGRIEVHRDVTEVLRRERELADANERKDRFVATLSHELRTPLTPILGWIELLRTARDPAEIARGLEAIRRNVELEAQLVDDLLDLSRIVNQKLALHLQPVDVATALRAAVETVTHLAETKGVRLAVRVPSAAVVVQADETRLIQVVWNLLSNAIKFTPSGGEVRLTTRADGSRLEVSVEDDGEGIAAEFLPHVFKPFEQGERGAPARGGLGIGLALSRSLVERHGGAIAAESEGAGRGARFTFWIPLTRAGTTPRERSPAALEAALAGGATGNGEGHGRDGLAAAVRAARPGGRRLLLVEDNPDTLEAMRVLLTAWGYDVRAARSVRAALEMTRREPPDVVISDIGMPDVDGLAFARQIRESGLPRNGGGRLSLVAISGYASPADRRGALDAGFDAYLTKPIDFVSLKALLDRLAPAAASRG